MGLMIALVQMFGTFGRVVCWWLRGLFFVAGVLFLLTGCSLYSGKALGIGLLYCVLAAVFRMAIQKIDRLRLMGGRV